MTRQNKITGLLIAATLTASFLPQKAMADKAPNLTLYAGPQSVSPLDTIYVTVEITDMHGHNMDREKVELSFLNDGKQQYISGYPKHGLISFDVPAQKRQGLMTFSAKAGGGTSNEVLVAIVAASPSELSLKIIASPKTGYLTISSKTIVDKFGNTVSDLSLTALNWIDNGSLIGSQSLQLSQGQLNHSLPCPAQFLGPLQLHASLSGLGFMSTDISTLCRTDAG